MTYDVRPYLLEGDNELVIWLGQGWYKRGTFGRWQPDEPYEIAPFLTRSENTGWEEG